jgi:acylphosphatase
MQEICINYIISGIVQGVGFRSFAINKANSLGIKGWIRNLSTGEVEVMACGAKSSVAEFGELMKVGPSASRVKGVTKKILGYENYDNFLAVSTK